MTSIWAEPVAELLAQNLRSAVIAARLGIAASTVERLKAELGLTKRTPQRANRVTPETLNKMRAMIDDGASSSEVARTVGVNVKTVYRYFPGQQWGTRQASEYANLVRATESVVYNQPFAKGAR